MSETSESYLVLGGVESNLYTGDFEYLPLAKGDYWGSTITSFGFSGSING